MNECTVRIACAHVPHVSCDPCHTQKHIVLVEEYAVRGDLFGIHRSMNCRLTETQVGAGGGEVKRSEAGNGGQGAVG